MLTLVAMVVMYSDILYTPMFGRMSYVQFSETIGKQVQLKCETTLV